MEIDNNYSVETDANNFVLRYENKYFDEKSKKEKTTSREWYCVDMEHVNKIYLRECIREAISPNTEISELVGLIKNKECLK